MEQRIIASTFRVPCDKPTAAIRPLQPDGDGTILTESVAICRYIEALHPEPPLFGVGALEMVVHDGVAAGRFECADPSGAARRLSALLDGLGLDVILHGGPSRRRLLEHARIAAAAEIGIAPSEFTETR